MAVKLGEMLLKAGMITQPQLQEALEAQKKSGGKLGFNLVKMGFVKEDDITQLLSDQYGVPSINLRHFEIDESVIHLVPSEVAQKYLVLPVVASEMAIREAIEKYYGSSHALELKKVMDQMAEQETEALELLEEDEELDIHKLEHVSEEAPVVRLVNIILTDSIKKGASDIHVEPYEKDFRVRFRVD